MERIQHTASFLLGEAKNHHPLLRPPAPRIPPPPPTAASVGQASRLWVGVGAAAVVLYALFWGRPTPSTTARIAFVGNSFQFVNDLPRVLTAMAEPQVVIEQDSMLHGSLSLITLLKRGNGMRKRWKTENAWNETLGVYDYGACTLPQLLLGEDDYLTENNYDQVYSNDGFNPCFNKYSNAYYEAASDDDAVYYDDGDDDDRYYQDDEESQVYLNFTLATKMVANKTWDYVVLNDQSVRPAVPRKREKTVRVLESTYAPLFEQCGATPVFISTHGYWRDNLNLTELYGIQDVPHFTARLHKGYQVYAQTLSSLKPLVAPVGIAFLVVWEENPEMWDRLFGSDQYHPSPLGTYLMGCVVHATIFGRLPDAPTVSDATAGKLMINQTFAQSRSMGLRREAPGALPTPEEAVYLRWIAKQVVFRNYQPYSFREAWEFVEKEEEAEYGERI